MSPERYWMDLIHGMYTIQVCLRSMYLGTDQQCYTVRVARSAIAGKQEEILYLLMFTYIGFGGSSNSPLHHMDKATGGIAASKGRQKWSSCDVGMHYLDATCQHILCNKIHDINFTSYC